MKRLAKRKRKQKRSEQESMRSSYALYLMKDGRLLSAMEIDRPLVHVLEGLVLISGRIRTG